MKFIEPDRQFNTSTTYGFVKNHRGRFCGLLDNFSMPWVMLGNTKKQTNDGVSFQSCRIRQTCVHSQVRAVLFQETNNLVTGPFKVVVLLIDNEPRQHGVDKVECCQEASARIVVYTLLEANPGLSEQL